jgi:transmembrane sensor
MDASERRNRAGEEAAGWFARLQAGDMERAEREEFVEWLRESHVHVAEMLRIAQIHGALEGFQRWVHISTGPKTDADNVVQLPSPPDAHLTERPTPVHTRRMGAGLRLLAVAATVLLIVASIVVLPRIRGQVIETDRGERREVVLADGSLLQVDPETRLRVKYSDSVRRVFLERGRALFHVAKNPSRPFLVQADDATVRAVGTAFGVEQLLQGIIVTVAEGRVAVFPTSRATATAAQNTDVPRPEGSNNPDDIHRPGARTRANSGNEGSPAISSSGKVVQGANRPSTQTVAAGEVLLTANQQVMVHNSGSAEPVREIDSQRALAWAQGRLIFQNDQLGQAIAEFNRYNHVQLTVTDPELAAKPVSGVFNAAEPDAFIAFLQSVTDVEIVRDGDRSITIGSVRHR